LKGRHGFGNCRSVKDATAGHGDAGLARVKQGSAYTRDELSLVNVLLERGGNGEEIDEESEEGKGGKGGRDD
jgi:hypothetical protein